MKTGIICGVKITFYNFLLALTIFLPRLAIAQGVGGTIINVNFGEGRTNPGQPLPTKNTSFSFSTDSCATPGSYTITNNLYRCPANRMGRSIDNTPGSDYGYMMLVNDTPSSKSRILFVDTLKKALCSGTQYAFSAYLLNTAIPGYCNTFNIHYPRFTFKVETTSGQLIQSSNTGLMPYDYDLAFTPKFHFYSVSFYPPPGVNGFVLKIEDDPSGYTLCGYSFALDDIQLTALGPDARIVFDDAVGLELVKTVCYQDNKTISMTGSVPAFYSNTALQWQQSIDSRVTWSDIPGATFANYSRVFSTPDTFLLRMSAGEAANISNPSCRVVSNILKIQVEGIPADFTVTSNSPVCVGNQLQFNATGGASYEWMGPNGFYDNVYYAHIYSTTLADSGTYYVDVISAGGCRARDSIYVRIIGTDIKLNVSADTSICKGNSVQLNASASISTNYSWSPPEGLSNTSVSNPVAAPTVTTAYTVKVTIGDACADSASVMVKIKNPVPVKAVIAGADYLCRSYDSASFRDVSIGNVAKWNWNFGNGQTDTSAKPATQYYLINDNNLNYSVRLIVADASGCSDTAYHLIKVVDNCYIAVPNAFTPNGDGLNDYLYPLNAYKATNLLFSVYDRSGQLIFETRDWTNKWDGKINGIPQPTGVYVWMLVYNDERGKKISLKGTTVLIR
ncbi:MAG: gliding motility-associated C-terminal domain-containing protein [Chitinophagales bacterium]